MGAILAKFRKEKTTTELLEKLENDIKEIEQYSISTQATQKRYVGNFLVISIGLYILGFLIFYFAFFPPTWMERISYSIPLLIFPLLIFLLKRLVAWYFQRKLNKNSSDLNKLKSEKKKVLEKVMDNETYKVALEILNRFGDKSNNYKPSGVVTPRITMVPSTPVTSVNKQLSVQSQSLNQRLNAATTPKSKDHQLISTTPRTNNTSFDLIQQPSNTAQHFTIQRKRTPFPIINPQNKGVLEKMVDYLIGDGPQNRFGMICKECYGHNGMALQEEFEYSAFRCAYCNAMNPSRKSRPVAPKLPMIANEGANFSQTDIILKNSDSSTSPSEKNSASESEDSEVSGINKLGKTEIKETEQIENVAEINEKPIEEKKID